ncbi:hypothetical protein CW713_10210 [Methanophagales archaeon]|nr:MAG: hypothetical protein CW713_10210 [Methanophagales archaeon]
MPGEDKSEGAGMKEIIGVFAIGLIVGIAIAVALGAFVPPQSQSISTANELKPEMAGQNAVAFFTDYFNYFVAPGVGVDVELINTTEVESANLYKIALNASARGTSQVAVAYMTKDGEMIFPQGIEIEDFKETVEQQKKEAEKRAQAQQQNVTIGNFFVSDDGEICIENGKPIVYFFGSNACGHCKWEHPVIVNVTSNFEGYISFHDNMNSNKDSEIFSKYSTGGVPALVIGCKYYRVGSGAVMGKEQEAKVLTALICELTDNKPADVCSNPEIEALLAQL